MKRVVVITLLLTVVLNTLNAQNGKWCQRWPPSPQEITAENVQQICALGVNPGRIIEARWHKTEPILVLLELASFYAPDQSLRGFYVWDVKNNVGRFDMADRGYTQMELTPELIVIGTDRGSILFWDLTKESLLYELKVHEGEVSEILLHPSEDWLVVVINKVRLFRYDLKTRSVVEIHLQESEDVTIQALAFSSEGRLLAVAGAGFISIWDTMKWVANKKAIFPSERSVSLHFTDNDAHLILLTDKSVSRWSLVADDLELVQTLEPLRLKRQCMLLGGDISPDDSLLMTTDICGQLRAWDLELDREIHIPQLRYIGEDHVGVPTKFSPDGRYLVDRVEPYGFVLLIVPEHE